MKKNQPERKLPLWHRLGMLYGGDLPLPLQRGKFTFVFILCLPAVLGLIVWYFGVNAQSILMAFQDAQTGEYSLINFTRLWAELQNPSSDIFIALKNTLKYFVLSVAIIPPVTYMMSFYLYRKIRGYKFFLVMIHLPNIISGVVIAAMISNLISPLGPISMIMDKLSFGLLPNLFADPKTATKTLMCIVFVTAMDANVLLWIGTFKRVPQEVIESATLDGTTEWQLFARIVTPMCASTIATLTILGCTGIFMASGPILLYTNGVAETTTLSFWIYQQTMLNQDLNYPAAIGIFFTLVGVPFVLFLNWLSDKVVKAVEY